MSGVIIENLSKSFPKEDGDVIWALKNINLEIQDKEFVCLVGPSGCGKTLLAESLARLLDVPFAIVDATTLTEAGYVGDDVENVILKLLQNADFDSARAETGIIYIDEIDKTARKSDITRRKGAFGVVVAASF